MCGISLASEDCVIEPFFLPGGGGWQGPVDSLTFVTGLHGLAESQRHGEQMSIESCL